MASVGGSGANITIAGGGSSITFDQTPASGNKDVLTSQSNTVINSNSNLTFNTSTRDLTFGGTYQLTQNQSAVFTLNSGDEDEYTEIRGFGGTIVQRWDDSYTYITGGGLIVGATTSTTTNGLIRATNDVIAYYSSDRRLKTNILNIPNALEKVSMLNGVTFDWKEFEANKNKEIHANEGHDVGIIAQEVEAIFPEIVDNRKNGYKAVKYDRLVAVLIEAVKELNTKVKILENQLKEK